MIFIIFVIINPYEPVAVIAYIVSHWIKTAAVWDPYPHRGIRDHTRRTAAFSPTSKYIFKIGLGHGSNRSEQFPTRDLTFFNTFVSMVRNILFPFFGFGHRETFNKRFEHIVLHQMAMWAVLDLDTNNRKLFESFSEGFGSNRALNEGQVVINNSSLFAFLTASRS